MVALYLEKESLDLGSTNEAEVITYRGSCIYWSRAT